MTRIPVVQDRHLQGYGCRAHMDAFMKDNIWQLQEAKSKFSQLVEAAIRMTDNTGDPLKDQKESLTMKKLYSVPLW